MLQSNLLFVPVFRLRLGLVSLWVFQELFHERLFCREVTECKLLRIERDCSPVIKDQRWARVILFFFNHHLALLWIILIDFECAVNMFEPTGQRLIDAYFSYF